MTRGLGNGPNASADEICSAIQYLTRVQRYRLQRAARASIRGTDYSTADELLGETVKRLLNDSRKWPRHVPFEKFLVNAMRSVAHGRRGYVDGHPEVPVSALLSGGEWESDEILDVIDGTPGEDCAPEEMLAYERRGRLAAAMLNRVSEKFRDDEEITWILLGIEEEWSSDKLLDESGMTRTQYESARRRLSRQLKRFFPEGSRYDDET